MEDEGVKTNSARLFCKAGETENTPFIVEQEVNDIATKSDNQPSPSQIPLEPPHRISPLKGVVVHPHGAFLLRLALLGLRREAHQQPLFRQLLVA